jgi:hypothetical protein
LVGGFERLAIACLYEDTDQTALPLARSEPRTRTALMLESIALHHQIAVLERNGTRRPCFSLWDRLFWILLSHWWSKWRDSLIIIQPATVLRWRREDGQRFGNIDPGVAGAVGAPGFPAKSDI